MNVQSFPSASMLAALKWLRNRNGDGVFDRNHVLVAGGDRAPIMRATWNKLETSGLIEFYLDRRRVRVTQAGCNVDVSKVEESA
ncbi:hypothetical protein FJ872_19545 [Mesorhizobium sp. B2-5-9]|uniref:hypothetical protein n=1 Tax=Mesorhizobium sp. B2-5-9 TaxID=2589921 RepID=UPI001125B492|nr:hypothetical protein [Mesorhizobium sp. B2-5-9]TPK15192.1 hypothetical protein FJ872_19545 [Mesorhizobium sp. B2-5-9]